MARNIVLRPSPEANRKAMEGAREGARHDQHPGRAVGREAGQGRINDPTGR
jgi:hypothetical protein